MLDRPPARPPPLRSRRAVCQRQYRARQRAGIAIAPVPYDGKVVNFLIATHWLDAALADDRAEVGKAIRAMVAGAARARR
jgi:hypothetical protein